MALKIFKNSQALQSELKAVWGRHTLGFVPTMGALHAGHGELVRRAVAENERCLVSIFVNPTQFGPNEDLSRYPRTPEADLELLEAMGAHYVWMPEVVDMYPSGGSLKVSIGELGTLWEGASRPGHFDGVCLVVNKLLGAAWPSVAYFGEKDFQQTVVLRRLARELLLPCQIVVCPTVREADGLALSSRNRYLNPDQRQAAPAIYRAMQTIVALAKTENDVAHLLSVGSTIIAAENELRIDYLAIVDRDNMAPLTQLDGRPAQLITAVFAGSTRLLDNCSL